MRYDDEPNELEEALIEARNRIERSVLWDVRLVFKELLSDEVDCRLIPRDEELSWKSYYEIAKNAHEKQNWPKAGTSLVNMLESRMLLEQQHKAFMEDNELKLFYIFQNRSLDKVKFFISNNYQIEVIKCNIWISLCNMAHEEIIEQDNSQDFSSVINFFEEQAQYEKEIQNTILEDEIPLYYFLENCSLNSAKKFFEKKYSLTFPHAGTFSWNALLKYVDSQYIEGFLENDVLMQVLQRRLDDKPTLHLDKDTKRIINTLRKMLAKACLLSNAEKPRLQLNGITSWNMLLNFIRDFRPQLRQKLNSSIPMKYFPTKGNSDHDDLFSAVMARYNEIKSAVPKTRSGWKTCSVCWRPVPAKFEGNAGRIYCQYHNSYRRGDLPTHKNLKAKAKAITHSIGVYGKYNSLKQKLYALISFTDEDRTQLTEKVILVWEQNPCQALTDLPCKIAWPKLDNFFDVLPELKTIFQNEQELSPQIIVEKLTPIHPNLDAEEHAQMQALNDIWINNFYLYVTELVRAELWLQRCRKIHGKVLFPA